MRLLRLLIALFPLGNVLLAKAIRICKRMRSIPDLLLHATGNWDGCFIQGAQVLYDHFHISILRRYGQNPCPEAKLEDRRWPEPVRSLSWDLKTPDLLNVCPGFFLGYLGRL